MRPLFPQSTGPDGRDRLLQAWKRPPMPWAIVTEPNNTHVGLLYIGTGFMFFLGAGVLALMMRLQLAFPNGTVLDHETYNQFFTMHGTTMMFLFAVPIVEAFAVYLLPQMLGARDLPFPRLSAYGYWAYAIGGTMVFGSLFFGVAPDGGWFMYPPLTGQTYSPGVNADLWLLGLSFIEVSAISAAVEMVVGVFKTRAPNMRLSEVPVYAWFILVMSFMVVIGFPPVIAASLLLEMERALDMPFFDPTRGGDPLLWQHLFWLFGHPEVYIIFMPAAGAVSAMIPALAGARLVGHVWVVMAAIAVGFLSFGLWVHHMYATGLPRLSLSFFAAASMAIAIPMGILVFAWIATFWEGRRPALRTPTLFILGFLFIFTLGGLTGVMVASVPYDWQVHDTYFVVAHFHYVLVGGMVFPIFAAFYYWSPIVSGRMMSERLGRWAFWLMFVGFNAAFLPMHVTGLRGMPRRVYTYPDDLGWNLLNLFSTVFAWVFALGVAVALIDFIRHFRSGREAGPDPWGAGSLEFLGGGADYAMRSIPSVKSLYPVWDQPNLKEEIEAGRWYIPDAPTVERESLITSPINGEPQLVVRMPGPGWLAFPAAVATAGFFFGLTFKLTWFSAASGVAAFVLLLAWCWTLDRDLPSDPVDIGRGEALPIYAGDSSSHGLWGMVVTLIADFSIAMSLAFAYVFIWAADPEPWPPDGSRVSSWGEAIAVAGVVVVAWIAFELAERFNRRNHRGYACFFLILAAIGLLASAVAGTSWLHNLGISATATAYGASAWTLLAYAGLHIGIAVVMALYCLARLTLGMIDARRCMSLKLSLVWMRYTGALSLAFVGLLAGFPHVV